VSDDGEPVSADAVEHAARMVARREHRWFQFAAGLTVAAAAGMATWGLGGIPIGIVAFALAGRAMGRKRRARELAEATRDATRTWSLVGHTVRGRSPGRGDLELVLPPGEVRSLRALPAARVVSRSDGSS
jgi:hypothetical protein